VLAAIDLDHELRLDAGEIGNEAINRHLSPKLVAELLRAETGPQLSLGVCRVAAKPTGDTDRLHPLTLLA
jgi:hypothetical protein